MTFFSWICRRRLSFILVDGVLLVFPSAINMGDLETGQRGQQSRRRRAPPVQKKVHARDFGFSSTG